MKNKYLCLITITFLNFQILSLFGQSFPVNEIIINGDNFTHINIVFLSEGYTINEMGQFNTDVQICINDLMNEIPYMLYQSLFNVYSIEVPSNESGTDHPGTAPDCGPYANDIFYADTYFESSFDKYNIHRLLVIQNIGAAYSILQNNLPVWDIAFIIVNHPMYGGSGGTFTTFSLANSSSEIAIHELGHSFSNLADEYWAGSQYANEKANMTQESDPNLIKWSEWLYDYGTGIYEYEPPGYGWYRPHQSCKMRYLGYPFCSVCSEQTVISMYNLLNTIESYQPSDTSITLYQGDSLDFIIQRMHTTANTIKNEWYIDTTFIEIDSDTFNFNTSTNEIGYHQIQVIATDTTEVVRNDPNILLSSSVTWHILVESTHGIGDYSNELLKNFQLNQNFPNPFNATTTISFQLPKFTFVILSVYSINGQLIETLVSQEMPPGSHDILWKANNVGSGVYFYKISAGEYLATGKCLLLK